MLQPVLASLLLVVVAPEIARAAAGPAALATAQDPIDEYRKRRAGARGDVTKLHELAAWCAEQDLERQRGACLEEILELDPEDARAHEALGHTRYDGRWFTSERKLEAYRKKKLKEEERAAKARGWVRHGDRWVPPEDIQWLERGHVRGEDGNWLAPEDALRLAEGWVRQDLAWIPPDEAGLVAEGLWKCADEWVSLEEANAYHTELERWWRIPGGRTVLFTTLPRHLAERALAEMEAAYTDLERIFGLRPDEPPIALVLRSPEQYAAFTGGDWEKGEMGKSVFGFNNVHGAYFADNWFEDGRLIGAGVAYWDPDDAQLASFGPLWARHAVGQSFVERIDPSPEALATIEDGEVGFEYVMAFWEEKRFPLWLRFGAAVYVERYYVDPAADDPLWARTWSVDNVQRTGGLDSLSAIFRMMPRPDQPEKTSKLLNEAGLLVAFVVDGECAPVVKAHTKLIDALKLARRDPEKGEKALKKAIDGLEKALSKKERELRSFAGL